MYIRAYASLNMYVAITVGVLLCLSNIVNIVITYLYVLLHKKIVVQIVLWTMLI